tara:strand:+ start:19684 stop:20733 length:1050 start_codon:yes stop_codon:yes gene_type:complete
MSIKKLKINKTETVKDALKQISDSGKKCLLVCEENKFLGTLSGGDIRKALLKNISMETAVKNIFNKNSYYVYENDLDLEEVKRVFLKHKYDLIPVLDKNDKPLRVLEWNSVFRDQRKKQNISCPVVIMAGGKGTRLKPFTNVLPKPLIPLKDKTVIEKILDRFYSFGVKDYFLTINYKGKILKAFFEELEPEYNLEFIEEKRSLGTAGILYKLDGIINETFLLANCDVLVEVDYSELLNFHKKNKCDITLVASAKEIVIPYGSCEVDNKGYLKKINEKPKLDYLVNTGLYVLEPDTLSYIPRNKFFHITDLIELLKKKKRKIGVFPIDDADWVDIGQWDEYRSAVKRLN